MANQGEQGTGKHGHKDTQEPWPHHGQGGSGQQQQGGGSQGQQSGGGSQAGAQQGSGGSEEHSLQEREYRDKQGNVHHHTNTYMEQHEEE